MGLISLFPFWCSKPGHNKYLDGLCLQWQAMLLLLLCSSYSVSDRLLSGDLNISLSVSLHVGWLHLAQQYAKMFKAGLTYFACQLSVKHCIVLTNTCIIKWQTIRNVDFSFAAAHSFDSTTSICLACRCFCIITQSTRSATLPRTPGTTGLLATSAERRATTGLWPSRPRSL